MRLLRPAVRPVVAAALAATALVTLPATGAPAVPCNRVVDKAGDAFAEPAPDGVPGPLSDDALDLVGADVAAVVRGPAPRINVVFRLKHLAFPIRRGVTDVGYQMEFTVSGSAARATVLFEYGVAAAPAYDGATDALRAVKVPFETGALVDVGSIDEAGEHYGLSGPATAVLAGNEIRVSVPLAELGKLAGIVVKPGAVLSGIQVRTYANREFYPGRFDRNLRPLGDAPRTDVAATSTPYTVDAKTCVDVVPPKVAVTSPRPGFRGYYDRADPFAAPALKMTGSVADAAAEVVLLAGRDGTPWTRQAKRLTRGSAPYCVVTQEAATQKDSKVSAAVGALDPFANLGLVTVVGKASLGPVDRQPAC
jgi:hypothetical protein